MNLYAVQQCELGFQSELDLVVGASGYESRARFVPTQLAKSKVEIRKRMALAFKEHKDACARVSNDRTLKRLGYSLPPCSGRSTDEVHEIFDDALKSVARKSSAHILIDISCMTRTWYGEIVHTLRNAWRHREVVVDFVYTPAQFRAPQEEYPANRVAGPVPGFMGMSLPDRPTALGIGLGYDRDRALGLKDYLDPKVTVLFYPNPSVDRRYVQSVRTMNEELLALLSSNNVVAYPIADAVATFGILDSMVAGLARTSRVVLCSLGPKIFGLCCFLVATVRNEISIWRVSADDREAPVDHKPSGSPLVLRTIWRSEKP